MKKRAQTKPAPKSFLPIPAPTNVWRHEGDNIWRYEFGRGNRRICLTVYNHRDHPDAWVMHCHGLGIDTEVLPGGGFSHQQIIPLVNALKVVDAWDDNPGPPHTQEMLETVRKALAHARALGFTSSR